MPRARSSDRLTQGTLRCHDMVGRTAALHKIVGLVDLPPGDPRPTGMWLLASADGSAGSIANHFGSGGDLGSVHWQTASHLEYIEAAHPWSRYTRSSPRHSDPRPADAGGLGLHRPPVRS